jgi:ATP-dependent protease ClpP protease subunit
MTEHLTNFSIGVEDALLAEGVFLLASDVDYRACRALTLALLRFGEIYDAFETKPPVHLHLSSVGGNVHAGLMVGATLMQLKARGHQVHTYIVGQALSMAIALAQYGDVRHIDRTAIVLVHAPAWSPGSGTAEEQRSMQGGIEKITAVLARLMAYRNNAGFNKPEWWAREMFDGRDHYFNAEDAVLHGLADSLIGGYPVPPDKLFV